MVPCASTLSFTGQELARRLPRVLGIVLETLLSTIVEMVLFITLIARPSAERAVTVIKAAILGSILANMLLALGICLLVGGLKYKEQTFHSLVGGTSSDVLLGSGFALLLPAVYFSALYTSATTLQTNYTMAKLNSDTLSFSRGTSIILLVSFTVYMYQNVSTHRTLFDRILASEEETDETEHKLTLVECLVVAAVSLACVCVLAYILVRTIHPIVEATTISENFMGLIIVPLVEKVSEHVTAVRKATKNQPNMAIFKCISPSIQTTLFNAPLVVIVGWGLNKEMNLNFETFQIVAVILAIIVVINFLGDGSSNYLKGYILVVVYCTIAVGAWYYPSITVQSSTDGQPG